MVIQTFFTKPIHEDGIVTINDFNGEILKVVAFAEEVYPNVKLQLESDDGETLCNDVLQEKVTRFYPKNLIPITQDQSHLDNYYINGKLFLRIDGLGDNETIKTVAIYYK